jgi:hypothetical protein
MKLFRACPVKDRKMLEFPKHRTVWNIMLEGMTVNVVISEVDALTYVVLSKAANHVPWVELFVTTECITL